MSKTIVLILILKFTFIVEPTYAQNPSELTLTDSVASYFNEVKMATKKNRKLWGINIYGPIILVNPVTRQAYSNYPDSSGTLKAVKKIYTGILPNNVVLGNATTFWHGRHWAMVMLSFLSKTSKVDRINLLSHELFHNSQEKLKFKLIEPTNNHLDQKEGRVLLRLELEELKIALQAKGDLEMKQHLTNAITIRKYRYKIYPEAEFNENWAELNEGMAEYTGIMISGRNKKEITIRLQQKIDELMTFGTFIRTFAYRTTPVYGYLLRRSDKYWNKTITNETNLTNYFIEKFKLSIPFDLDKYIKVYTEQSFAKKVVVEETEREKKVKGQIAFYIDQFITQPHLEITFEKKRVSFDSRNLLPLQGYGIVYPTLTASDNWGILKVDSIGGLMSPGRDKITITAPFRINDREILGDGWSLRLNTGYKVIKDERSGNYSLIKN